MAKVSYLPLPKGMTLRQRQRIANWSSNS